MIFVFLLGFFVGTIGTMIGVGGGFILVPVFLLVFHLPHQIAVGTSLFIVFFNALSGTIVYMRERLVDYRAGIIFALATLPGALIGSMVVRYISGPLFQILFGILLFVISCFLFLKPEKKQNNTKVEAQSTKMALRTITSRHGKTYSYSYSEPLGATISVFVGFLSSLLGIGGGAIHVPAMIHLLSFPAHVATASSHFVLAWSTLAGAGMQFYYGAINFSVAIPATIGAVLGAQLGARMAKKIKAKLLVRLLASALLLVALRLLFIH